MSQEQEDTGTIVKERTRQKYKKPRMQKVIFHNDDYTPFEFVVSLLTTIYRKSETEARALAREIHASGAGVAGIYTAEIAETKIAHTNVRSKTEEHPLQLSMEPEE